MIRQLSIFAENKKGAMNRITWRNSCRPGATGRWNGSTETSETTPFRANEPRRGVFLGVSGSFGKAENQFPGFFPAEAGIGDGQAAFFVSDKFHGCVHFPVLTA